MSRNRTLGKFAPGRDSYFTSWSLKVPFGQHSDTIGQHRVAVWANNPELPPKVISSLKTAFANTNRDLRELMCDTVQQAEKHAVPMACIILGKAPR